VNKMTLPVAVAVAIVGCVLAVSANVTTSKMHSDLEQERYKRMAAEQQIQKFRNIEMRYKAELRDTSDKIRKIKEILDAGKSKNKSLKGQLNSVSQERSSLLKEKEALMQRISKMQKEVASSTPRAQGVNP